MKVINKDASDIVKQATQESPLRAAKIKKAYKQVMESVAPNLIFSLDRAFLFVLFQLDIVLQFVSNF